MKQYVILAFLAVVTVGNAYAQDDEGLELPNVPTQFTLEEFADFEKKISLSGALGFDISGTQNMLTLKQASTGLSIGGSLAQGWMYTGAEMNFDHYLRYPTRERIKTPTSQIVVGAQIPNSVDTRMSGTGMGIIFGLGWRKESGERPDLPMLLGWYLKFQGVVAAYGHYTYATWFRLSFVDIAYAKGPHPPGGPFFHGNTSIWFQFGVTQDIYW